MESILSARLEIPYWCSFRVPYAVNVHFTYPVPPVTTLYGLVAAAMGYPADHVKPMDELCFGIAISQDGNLLENYSSIIKWDRRFQGMRTQVIKQKLYQPDYYMYIGGEENNINDIACALKDPVFPLFLGESDDVVEVKDVQVYSPSIEECNVMDCCVPAESGRARSYGITVVHLPVGFKTGSRGSFAGVEYRDYYVGPVVELEQPVQAYNLGGKRVVLK